MPRKGPHYRFPYMYMTTKGPKRALTGGVLKVSRKGPHERFPYMSRGPSSGQRALRTFRNLATA